MNVSNGLWTSIAACAAFSFIPVGCASRPPAPPIDRVVTASTDDTLRTASAESFIGSIDAGLGPVSRQAFHSAMQEALERGVGGKFDVPSEGVRGSVEAGSAKAIRASDGKTCRRYSTVIWVVGTGSHVNGVACRARNGIWAEEKAVPFGS